MSSIITGNFERGERFCFADFIELPISSIIWGKSSKFNGPLMIETVDDNFRSITDGEKIGIGVEFPNIAPDSNVACGTPFGQMEFYEAIPITNEKL